MKKEAIEALQLFKQMHLAQPEPVEAPTEEPKVKSFNYPDHIKPLKDRMMTAIKNGNRTAEAIANYCKADVKLVTLQLGRYVSRGMIGRHTNPQSGITRYYTYAEAQDRGILQQPAPINRKKKGQVEAKVEPQAPSKDQKYITFLENRLSEWQAEARKQAHQIQELQDLLSQAIAKANAPRNVTGEVEEVMKEVMDLRATVAYLESKLFGGK